MPVVILSLLVASDLILPRIPHAGVETAPAHDVQRAAVCFAPGTSLEVVAEVEAKLRGGRQGDVAEFRQTDRWATTALDPMGGGQGNPTTITYSFVPDGTAITPFVDGESSDPSNLFAVMRSKYGSGPADISADPVWQDLYHRAFDRWGELCGVTYVYEPNDDGGVFRFAPGFEGVRGDVRIGGHRIDGDGSILGYNFFPLEGGDMVLDTDDNTYDNLAQDSRTLRNIIAHEHGHGLGMFHVCPLQNNKLMEPNLSTVFDGPQFDDILNAQRHYGDPLEPNDSIAEATDLGLFEEDGAATRAFISLDDDSDTDYFEFAIMGLADITFSVTPIGMPYLEGPQDFSGGPSGCSNGSQFTPINLNDLSITLLDSGGGEVLSVNDNPAGSAEVLTQRVNAGTHFLRVAPGISDAIQAYDLMLTVDTLIDPPPFFPPTIAPVATLPESLPDGQAVSFDVLILPNDGQVFFPPTLNWRAGGAGAFSTTPLTLVSGDRWRATLPGFDCNDQPEFFVSIDSDMSGLIRFPPVDNAAAIVGTEIALFADNGQTNEGWTVSGVATNGVWERGVPIAIGQGDPPADFDGSGACWLTGNTPFDDVDSGDTRLTSVPIDVAFGDVLTYAYWLNDSPSSPLNGDSLRVRLSIDGGKTFRTIRTYLDPADQWRTERLDVGFDFAAAPTIQLQFIAEDAGGASAVEAGLDAIRVLRIDCDGLCRNPSDVNRDGTVSPADFTAWLSAFNNSEPAADQNADGSITPADFTRWLANFNVGCE